MALESVLGSALAIAGLLMIAMWRSGSERRVKPQQAEIRRSSENSRLRRWHRTSRWKY